MANQQQTLEQEMLRALQTFERVHLSKQTSAVSAQIRAAASVLTARINELSNGKGKLTSQAVSALQAEIDALERMLYRQYSDALRAQLEVSSQYATMTTSEALFAAIGPTALATATGLATTASLSTLLESGVLPTLFLVLVFGASTLEVARGIAEAIMSRTADNGVDTRKRIRIFAREVSQEIQRVVKANMSAGDVIREIDRVVNEAEWRIARLVETESMTAYRTSVAKLSERSDIISAVRIIDFAEGHEDTHARHKCYAYARADEHGMGEGVYPPSTYKIRNPHAQCRSILVPVIAEGFEEE